MKIFLLTLLISFLALLSMMLLISYCRRKSLKSRHSLTGMCHKKGDAACCSSILVDPPKK